MEKSYRNVYFFSLIFFVIDQVIKYVISSKMILNQNIVLFKNFLSIRLTHNTGAAFSILEGNTLLLVLIGIIAFLCIVLYLKKLDRLNDGDIFIYSLLLGGLLGNLFDRIIHGYVIDYISFNFNGYLFPVFNFADICIVISILLIVIGTLKEDIWKK